MLPVEQKEKYLRCLDVVVEVVTESLDVGDAIVAALGGQVSREQNYIASVEAKYCCMGGILTECDVAHLALACVLHARNTLQLKWGSVAEEHLRRIL